VEAVDRPLVRSVSFSVEPTREEAMLVVRPVVSAEPVAAVPKCEVAVPVSLVDNVAPLLSFDEVTSGSLHTEAVVAAPLSFDEARAGSLQTEAVETTLLIFDEATSVSLQTEAVVAGVLVNHEVVRLLVGLRDEVVG
jgi:hypothetical protein